MDNSNNNNNNNNCQRTFVTPKNYSKESANNKITDGLNYYIKLFNASIADIITHAGVGRWEASIEVHMPDYFFNEIWNDTKWIGTNGDHLKYYKWGIDGKTTKRGNGYMATQYVWDKINDGIEIMGLTSEQYINKVHTFDLNKSPYTKKTTLFMCFEKRHVDSKAWNIMKAPKKQQ